MGRLFRGMGVLTCVGLLVVAVLEPGSSAVLGVLAPLVVVSFTFALADVLVATGTLSGWRAAFRGAHEATVELTGPSDALWRWCRDVLSSDPLRTREDARGIWVVSRSRLPALGVHADVRMIPSERGLDVVVTSHHHPAGAAQEFVERVARVLRQGHRDDEARRHFLALIDRLAVAETEEERATLRAAAEQSAFAQRGPPRS